MGYDNDNVFYKFWTCFFSGRGQEYNLEIGIYRAVNSNDNFNLAIYYIMLQNILILFCALSFLFKKNSMVMVSNAQKKPPRFQSIYTTVLKYFIFSYIILSIDVFF